MHQMDDKKEQKLVFSMSSPKKRTMKMLEISQILTCPILFVQSYVENFGDSDRKRTGGLQGPRVIISTRSAVGFQSGEI